MRYLNQSQQYTLIADIAMSKKSQAEMLIEELCVRFERKPRKCKKRNDSGIGNSERIVCVSNERFYYYPKIQEFNDLDFDKLQYVVPKAGIKLQEILELKFPPRRSNERNYFTLTIPNNKILKYTKTFKEMVIDEFAEGEQEWTFIFDYDIISLPELEKRLQIIQHQERERQMKKKQKEEEEMIKRQEETKKKMEQQYQSLVQTQKMISQRENDESKKRKIESSQQNIEKMLEVADELYFHEAYQKLLKNTSVNQTEIIDCELDVLESIGRFKKRAQQVVKKYIDELPFNLQPNIDKKFLHQNLMIKIGLSKHLNEEFLDSMKVAHAIYNIRKKIDNKIRVPLMALIKYKGLKVLVKTVTPCDFMSQKEKEQQFLHGNYNQNWKTHFFLVDDLNLILESLNLKPYNSERFFQRIVIHLGTHLQLISTKQDPFESIKRLKRQLFSDFSREKIIYAFNITEIFPIDLDLQKDVKQDDLRLRPEFVINYKEGGPGKETPTKLVGGALTYEYQDEQGAKDDLSLAKASQNLKYIHIVSFVKDLDKLKFVPMNSQHLKTIMKENGINMRYISAIYKLTSLPYIREMITIEAIAREIKKIYRDYQVDFIVDVFRNSYGDIMKQAFDNKSMNSLKVIRKRQLFLKEKQKSIQNSIDFLNLIFGNGVESQNFWQIIKKKVKQNYKITVKEHADLSHGYLLMTILYHCGFSIKLNSSLLLFSTPQPFTTKDWIQFKCRTVTYTYPSLEVYKKCKISPDLTEETIINRLELNLYICRALGNDQSKILAQLSTYTRNPEILSTERYSVENLKYYVSNPNLQKFQKAYDICTFVLPSSHPYIQDFYLQFASLKSNDAVILKKAAENHSIRTLGINHWKTSSILSGFQEEAYLKHLIAAELDVEPNKKMQLYHKIVQQQQRLGKFIDCFNYVKVAISFAVSKKDMSVDEQEQFFKLLTIGMQVTYRLRKIEDLLRISQYFWTYLQQYRRNTDQNYYFEHILYYCLKGYLESSNKKYYLFKVVIVLHEKSLSQKQIKKSALLSTLRQKCRQSKNHINWIKQLLTKLQFAYTQINFLPDFFTHFWQNVQKLHSEQLQEGLDEMSYLVRVFQRKPFEEALLDRAYTFDKGSQWPMPKPQ